MVEPAPAPVEPTAAETAVVEDRGWFDSSWELRKGLDVAELAAFPSDSPDKLAGR